jgi:hypothetical protein
MLERFLDGIFGCFHTNYGFPVTVRARDRRKGAASVTGTYVVCLDCGKELPYDWQNMRVLYAGEGHPAAVVPALVNRQAA